MRLCKRVALVVSLAAAQVFAGTLPIHAATSSREVLWLGRPVAASRDFAHGPGGRAEMPQPPYRFIKEDLGGTNPKVWVSDARGRQWIVKWGPEVKSEVFASRLVWAAGYYMPPIHFVPSGRILGIGKLKRAHSVIDEYGLFQDARFKMIRPDMKYLSDRSWAWVDNPFLKTPEGRRELNGLKVLLMLTSNWDTKDNRNPEQGSNTVIFERRVSGRPEFVYSFDDWGATMGKWGGFFTREKWDCKGYLNQTPDFLKGVKHGYVEWGFSGKHKSDIKDQIPVEDVAWLLSQLRGIGPQQLYSALLESGADEEEGACFADALTDRIEQLRSLVAAVRQR